MAELSLSLCAHAGSWCHAKPKECFSNIVDKLHPVYAFFLSCAKTFLIARSPLYLLEPHGSL